MSQKNTVSVPLIVLSAVLIAACTAPGSVPVQPTATQGQSATAVRVTPSPSPPISRSLPTPVPIATWLAQGIPEDLMITYERGEWTIRITADGSATYNCCSVTFPDQFAGKLSPEVLRRVVMAFDETRFFYLEDADGCLYDVTLPTSNGMVESTAPGVTSVSITINGITKSVRYAQCQYIQGDYSGRILDNFRTLEDIIPEVVQDLRAVPRVLRDLRVRRAIAYCIDRRALVASAYPYIEDPDVLLMDSFLPKNHWAYGGPYEDMPQYDPEAGMALLEEAGWTLPEGATVRQAADGDILTLRFTTTNAQFRQTWGAVFVQNMAACGIEIIPNYVPASWWFGDNTGLASRDFELGAFAWVAQTEPGGRTLYACDQIPVPEENWEEGQNYMGWCNETASAAIIKATTAVDRNERVAAYAIVQDEFAKDVVSIPLFQRAEAEAWSANLEGVRTDPTEYATTNLHEWTLADGSDTIVVGISEEPDSLWSMISSKTASALVRTALGSERTRTEYAYDFQPRLQEPLSTIDSGLAANNDVEVTAGDAVLDKYGDVVDLGKWDRVLDSDGNEVEFDGATPIAMKQLVVAYRFKPFTWSDGTPGSIADFQLGQKIDCDPDISYTSSVRCDSIQSVDWADAADDDGLEYTVTYLPGAQDPTYFLAPFNPYPSARVLADGRVLADVPAEQWRTLAEVNEMPLSWGPYRVVEWVKGQSITLERNPFYDGEVTTPNVIFVFLTDRSQAVAQLLSGEVDYLDASTLGAAEVQTVIDAAEATGAIKYSIIASSTWEHIDINLSNRF